MSILNRIKELSKEYNYTFASLEREANLGQGTIRRWNTNIPSADKLFLVANLLHTNVEYLLTGTERNATETLSQDERQLITAYRKHPELQNAIKKMLDIDIADADNKPQKVFRFAARNGKGGAIELSDEQAEKLQNLLKSDFPELL